MIFLANMLVLAVMVGLGFLFQAIQWTWGTETMVTFCLGWIGATVMWQTVHKMRYGHWFDDEVAEDGTPNRENKSRGNGF